MIANVVNPNDKILADNAIKICISVAQKKYNNFICI